MQTPQTKEHSAQLKQDYQLKITLHFLLASLAVQENNDQNTDLTWKWIGGGENL